jgi:hypothetical protein
MEENYYATLGENIFVAEDIWFVLVTNSDLRILMISWLDRLRAGLKLAR